MTRAHVGTACALLAILSGLAACTGIGWVDKPTPEYGATLEFAIRNNLPFLFSAAALVLFGAAVLLWRSGRQRR